MYNIFFYQVSIYIFLIAKNLHDSKLTVSLRLKIGIGEIVMANNEFRKLPVGIQSFNVIREEGYLYVDKTDIIWNLANNGRQYNF